MIRAESDPAGTARPGRTFVLQARVRCWTFRRRRLCRRPRDRRRAAGRQNHPRGLGELYRLTERRELAREHLTSAAAMYREMGMTYWLEKVEAELTQRARGELRVASS